MTEGKAAKRGFITLATGKDEYYVLAHNLLMSYRFHSRSKVPFGIICDRRNEYTADFDTVVVMDDPQFSVFDKLKLPELAPFEETIFIEADCLAYRDLNGLWKVFRDAPDFNGLGCFLPLDSERGWIRPEFLGPFTGRFEQQFQQQGGVLFMRRGRLDDFISTCRYISLHLDDFHFKFENEEAVFTLASMVHGFMPVQDWVDVFCFYPDAIIKQIDIKRGLLRYSLKPPYTHDSAPGLFLLHWGSSNTRGPLYKREADAVVPLAIQGKHAGPFIPFWRMVAIVSHCARRLPIWWRDFISFLKSLVPLSFRTYLWHKIHD